MSDLSLSFDPVACKWAMENGLLTGYPDGRFGPKDPITREQFAVIEYRKALSPVARRLVAHTLPHSVAIVARTKDGLGTVGSGTIVAPGRILTDAHVVFRPNAAMTEFTPAHTIEVFFHPSSCVPGLYGEAEIVKADQDVDLALLSVGISGDFTWPVIKFADRAPEQGEEIHIVGTPMGRPWDYTRGAIRSLERVARAWKSEIECWATDAPINPGNSGGTAVNGVGEFIGVPEAKDVAVQVDDYAYVVPLGTCRAFVKSAGVEV